MKKIFSSLLLIAFTICNFALAAQNGPSDQYQGICIRQGKKLIELETGVTDLILKRKPFTIEFDEEKGANNNEWYPWTVLKVAATVDPEDKQYFKEGPITDDNPYFSYGSGLAGLENGEYPSMVIADYGCHLLFYNDDMHKRFTLIEKKSDSLLRGKWTVDDLLIIGEDKDRNVRIKKSGIDHLYLMLLIDRNDNDIIESGEYYQLNVKFK